MRCEFSKDENGTVGLILLTFNIEYRFGSFMLHRLKQG
jgi:hypothetical protein